MLFDSLLEIFNSPIFSRVGTIAISTVTILTAATGCTLPNLPGINNAAPAVYGVLKRDPTNQNIKKDGFVKANAVRSGDQVNVSALSNLDGVKMAQFDKDRLYLLTNGKGLFVSDNGGKEWQRKYIFPVNSDKKVQQEREADINAKIARNDEFLGQDVAFDPKNKNVIFVAGIDSDKLGKIYQSSNGGDTFNLVYTEVENNVAVNFVVVDPVNPSRLYASLDKGALVRSLDNGSNWQKIRTFEEAPVQIGFVPNANNLLFAVFPSKGIKTSNDDGQTWVDLIVTKSLTSIQNVNASNNSNLGFGQNNVNTDEQFKQFQKLVPVITGKFDGLNQRKDLDINNLEWLMIADRQLWITNGLNQKFTKLFLPLQNEQNNILDITFDTSIGSQKLITSVDSKLLESTNKGQSWSATDKIQITDKIGSITQIIVDRDNPEIIYLMLGKVKQQRQGLFG